MKHSSPLFVIDTCIGGLSVIESLHASQCVKDAVFVADYAVNPLGVKSDKEIADVLQRWLTMAEQHCDTAVIACNTLSVYFHQLFRTETRQGGLRQVVSMVDLFGNMVRSETDRLVDKKVLIIGTAFTASQPVYEGILKDALPGARVETIAATRLERSIARFESGTIELLIDNQDLRRAIENTDVAILACTCFPLIRAELEFLFPDVLFLDPGRYCEGLLPQGAPPRVMHLQVKVTGNAVAPARVNEFATSYLGNTCVLS